MYFAIYQAEIVLNSPFFIIKKIVSHQVYLRLRKVWLETATSTGENTLSITEKSLLTVTKSNQKGDKTESKLKSNSKLGQEKFSLLITPYFQALFWVDREIVEKYYQINVTFELPAIATYLNWLSQQSQYSKPALSKLLNIMEHRTTESSDYFHIFATKIVNLLSSDSQHQQNTIFQALQTPPVEKFLQEHIKQQQILSQIKTQVEHNLDLSEIIQMAIEQSRSWLAADRLVIYQFNSDFPASESSSELARATVTYEARANNDIESIL